MFSTINLLFSVDRSRQPRSAFLHRKRIQWVQFVRKRWESRRNLKRHYLSKHGNHNAYRLVKCQTSHPTPSQSLNAAANQFDISPFAATPN